MNGKTLLSILKIISEGLTAGFGIFGLVTEFKDKDQHITRDGKIALVGIVVSFIVSGAITAVENANARAEEQAHATEIRRLSRPLGILTTQVDYSLKVEPKDATSASITEIIGWTAKHQTRLSEVHEADFPDSLQAKLRSHGSISSPIGIEIYAKAFPCPAVAPLRRDPDLYAKASPGKQAWQYLTTERDSLMATRRFDTVIVNDRGLTTSVEDIPESTVMIWSDAFDDPHVRFQSLELNVGSGGTKFFLAGRKENEIRGAVHQLGYCYSKPSAWPPIIPPKPK